MSNVAKNNQEKMTPHFKTRDYYFASYLLSQGAKFLALEATDETDVLEFVLDFPEDFIGLIHCLKFWGSPEAEDMKRLLKGASYLKAELKRYNDYRK